MLIRDKKLVGLSLVKDEYDTYIGVYDEQINSIRRFERPTHNLYTIFMSFDEYFSDWEDQGFGIFVSETELGHTSLMIKDKMMHEMNADIVINDNSMNMYPEIRSEFKRYCRERLDRMCYLHVQINENDKEHHFSIDKFGNFIRICDVKGFLSKYPYYPNLSYVPKLFYRELQLVEESMARKHDLGLDFCLKLATDMLDEDILNFQDKFREDNDTFIFDKSNKKHVKYLLEYLKEKTPGNRHFNVINLLYSVHGYEYREMEANPHSYCIKYTHGMKRALIDLIVEDKECASIINTNIIPREDRNRLIRDNIELLKELKFAYHDTLDLKLIKECIERDISNLRYINISSIMKKDFDYACDVIDRYILENVDKELDDTFSRILHKYSNCIKETTIKVCIESMPIMSMSALLSIKSIRKFIPCIINRLSGEIIEGTKKEIQRNLNKIAYLLEDKYNIGFSQQGNNCIIEIIDKVTGEAIIGVEEPELYNELYNVNKEEMLDVYWEEVVNKDMLGDIEYDNTFAEAYNKQLSSIFNS